MLQRPLRSANHTLWYFNKYISKRPGLFLNLFQYINNTCSVNTICMNQANSFQQQNKPLTLSNQVRPVMELELIFLSSHGLILILVTGMFA